MKYATMRYWSSVLAYYEICSHDTGWFLDVQASLVLVMSVAHSFLWDFGSLSLQDLRTYRTYTLTTLQPYNRTPLTPYNKKTRRQKDKNAKKTKKANKAKKQKVDKSKRQKEISWFWCNTSWNLKPQDIVVLVWYITKSTTKKHWGLGVISHAICIHEILGSWCNI